MNRRIGFGNAGTFICSALTNINHHAASFVKKIGVDLLRDTLGFRGLVFSDALNMKGVSADYTTGELEGKALLAGNDVLLFSEDVSVAFAAIQRTHWRSAPYRERLDASVRRIIKSKSIYGTRSI